MPNGGLLAFGFCFTSAEANVAQAKRKPNANKPNEWSNMSEVSVSDGDDAGSGGLSAVPPVVRGVRLTSPAQHVSAVLHFLVDAGDGSFTLASATCTDLLPLISLRRSSGSF